MAKPAQMTLEFIELGSSVSTGDGYRLKASGSGLNSRRRDIFLSSTSVLGHHSLLSSDHGGLFSRG